MTGAAVINPLNDPAEKLNEALANFEDRLRIFAAERGKFPTCIKLAGGTHLWFMQDSEANMRWALRHVNTAGRSEPLLVAPLSIRLEAAEAMPQLVATLQELQLKALDRLVAATRLVDGLLPMDD